MKVTRELYTSRMQIITGKSRRAGLSVSHSYYYQCMVEAELKDIKK